MSTLNNILLTWNLSHLQCSWFKFILPNYQIKKLKIYIYEEKLHFHNLYCHYYCPPNKQEMTYRNRGLRVGVTGIVIPHIVKVKHVGIAGQVEVLHQYPIGTFWDFQPYGNISTHVHVWFFWRTGHIVL